MKKSQLRKIIKEEIRGSINEKYGFGTDMSVGSGRDAIADSKFRNGAVGAIKKIEEFLGIIDYFTQGEFSDWHDEREAAIADVMKDAHEKLDIYLSGDDIERGGGEPISDPEARGIR